MLLADEDDIWFAFLLQTKTHIDANSHTQIISKRGQRQTSIALAGSQKGQDVYGRHRETESPAS